MIRVEPAPEPENFNNSVRLPGLSAIAELIGEPPLIHRPGSRRQQLVINGRPITQRDEIPPEAFPPFWQGECLQELLTAYRRICAYVCVYIEPVTGAASVDHMIPKSVRWEQIYEWGNYRLACALMNSRKHDTRDVLDPFEVQDGWFQIEFVGFQVVANPELDEDVKTRVNDTIARLGLNENIFLDLRGEYINYYYQGDISLSYLIRRSPFVAKELHRQNKLRPGDVWSVDV